MAGQIAIGADAFHEYRVRIEVAGHQVEALIDTGFAHPGCQVSLALDDENYEIVGPYLHETRFGELHVVGGRAPVRVEGGMAAVSIVGLDGSQVLTRVVNAGENILGVCYFHQLTDFEIVWDLGQREMRIRRRE